MTNIVQLPTALFSGAKIIKSVAEFSKGIDDLINNAKHANIPQSTIIGLLQVYLTRESMALLNIDK